MPFYRFLIHGRDPRALDGARGFFATRSVFAADQVRAQAKALSRLAREFATGRSATDWVGPAPVLTVEEARPIGLPELVTRRDPGLVFYDED